MRNNIIKLIIVILLISFIFIDGCVEKPKPSISIIRIQNLINNASNGETIYVRNGTHTDNITLDKSITLIGEGRNSTFIDGGGNNVVVINANNCTIQGFTMVNRDNSQKTIGITINANNTTIVNNTISYCSYGIGFNQSSRDNIVFYNIIANNSYGLYLYSSSDNNISLNNIFSNNIKGIFMSNSNNNVVSMNIISNNEYGFSSIHSENNTISNNDIFSNNLYGIYIDSDSRNNLIQFNLIFNNSYGIRLKDAYFNNVSYNEIKDNIGGVNCCCGAKENIIYNNILKNNKDWNAKGNYNNQWDHLGIGNFWDNYTGVDNNGDGIGETPYTFINGQDNYPLINKSLIFKY